VLHRHLLLVVLHLPFELASVQAWPLIQGSLIAYLKQDPKSQILTKWGNDEQFGEVEVAKSAVTQQIVDEMRNISFTLNGSREDWDQFSDQWINLYRSWDDNAVGEKVPVWESTGPQHFIKASLFFRVGLERFGQSDAKIIGDDMVGDLPTARIFENGFTD